MAELSTGFETSTLHISTVWTGLDADDDSLSSSTVTFYVFYYTCLSLLAVICVTGNSLVLTALFRHKNLRVPSNAFLFSLAVADLLTGIVFYVYQISHIDIDSIRDTLGKYNALRCPRANCESNCGVVLASG